ncbi:MAG: MFS transporter [Anaerolineales bacterium]|nr:MFS transporter [Anaerolineales bacterium]
MNEYIILLRHNHNYRYLWLGNVVSLLGDWFNLLASADLISRLTSSGVAISYLFLARFLPLFLVSPLAGVIADRFSRQRIMIVSDVLRAFTVAGFLFIQTPEQVWLLYVLTIIQFCLSAFFTPSRSAVLANVVDNKDLVTANALDSFTWSTMLALGALLGGIVAAIFGTNTAFVLDAATFVFSGFLISRIHIPVQLAVTAGKQAGWLDFLDGFRYLKKEPFILVISVVKAAGSLVWGAVNVLEIPFANDVYPLHGGFLTRALHIDDGGTATLGIFYLVSGIGTGLGPLLLRRILGDRLPRMLFGIMVGFVFAGSGILLLGLSSTLPVFLTGTLIRTVGTGALWVFSAVILQMVVPNRFRGRVFAFEFAALTLTQSISTLAAGIMQDTWGWHVQKAAIVMGTFGLGVAIVWIGIYLFLLSRLDEDRYSPIKRVHEL